MEAVYLNEDKTINTTPLRVLPDRSSLNQKRVSVVITNTHPTATIWLAIDKEAEIGKGIPLYPGGSIERTATSQFLPPQKMITALSTAIGGTISIFEEVYQ